MATTKRTIIHSIDVEPDSGNISFRIHRLAYVDGVRGEPTYVRQPLSPGDDIDMHITHVNAYLKSQGFPEIEAEGVERLKLTAKHAWTPSRVKARQDRDAAEKAELLDKAAKADKDKPAKA